MKKSELKETVKDIFDDMNTAESRHEDFLRDVGDPFPRYRARRSNVGFWAILVPNIIGFVVGLAITRFLGLHGAAYIVIGAICAFAAGTYKSVAFDKIALRFALVRNALIMGAIVVMCIIVAITDK